MAEESIMTLLGGFFICGDDAKRRSRWLSEGEDQADPGQLLIDPPNFLLLDERLSS
jgi:ATPase subunit of ABC transporter with duplicated ATPase domains